METLLSEPIDTPVIVRANYYDPYKSMKYGIWAYFLLIIFEGALRKWFLPFAATPLLVVRDPIAIWLIYMAWRKNLLPSTMFLIGPVVIGFIGLYTAMFTGHGNLIVALYGARVFLVHFPLIFIIGRVFDREDVLKIGRVMIYLSIPMALLITRQFYSPQEAWVNRGVAGDLAGAGFSGSGDFKRPPGTFSFITGTIGFFGLLAPFLFYYWFNRKNIDKWVLIASSLAMVISIPFSISRSLLFEFVLTVAFAVIASMGKPENLKRIIIAFFAGLIALAVLSQTRYFTTATAAFNDRFTTANESEGGLVKGVIGNRFVKGYFGSLFGTADQPFWGYGIGMGTNVGSELLTGNTTFIIAEDEWGRIIGELGFLIGFTLIGFKVAFAFKIGIKSFRSMITGDLLPWLLLSFGFLNLTIGGWAQPTTLGFGVLIGGLLIASFKPVNIEQPDS